MRLSQMCIRDSNTIGIKKEYAATGGGIEVNMANVKESALELIGKTPLLKMNRLAKAHGCEADVLAKLEYFNPAGSVKDRAALYMICLLYTSRCV